MSYFRAIHTAPLIIKISMSMLSFYSRRKQILVINQTMDVLFTIYHISLSQQPNIWYFAIDSGLAQAVCCHSTTHVGASRRVAGTSVLIHFYCLYL